MDFDTQGIRASISGMQFQPVSDGLQEDTQRARSQSRIWGRLEPFETRIVVSGTIWLNASHQGASSPAMMAEYAFSSMG